VQAGLSRRHQALGQVRPGRVVKAGLAADLAPTGRLAAPVHLPAWLYLASDRRFDLFGFTFALGTLHHTLQQILEQMRVGPFTEYLERWSRARPSFGWPNEVGVAIYVGLLVASLVAVVVPWRRAALALTAVPFLLSMLVSPEEIDSHSTLMIGAYVILLALTVGELVERWLARDRLAISTDWYRYTRIGLCLLCALLYFFAFFYKLNAVWLSPERTRATVFLLAPVEPLLAWLGVSSRGAAAILAPLGIVGTLSLELAVPLLLLWPRGRLVGCLAGLVLHLPMLAQGVTDFPTLTIAFYPLFLARGEAVELWQRLHRPARGWIVWTTAPLGAFGCWAIGRADNVQRWYQDSPGLDPLLMVAHLTLLDLTFVLFVYTMLALIDWLGERRRRPAGPPEPAW
jgi:hypothetical protein